MLRDHAGAIHDSLTGALNRGAFEQRLEAELARTDRLHSADVALYTAKRAGRDRVVTADELAVYAEH